MEDYKEKDTIFALSTPYGKSAVAVIRLSGNSCLKVLRSLGYGGSIQPRAAKLITLKIPKDAVTTNHHNSQLNDQFSKSENNNYNNDSILDHAIVLYFKSPNSFTGQDMLELHLHGSIAVIRDSITVLQKIPCLRMAQPGEFSRLAFSNGKFDLTKIEALADLIDSETSIQRQIATQQLSGQLQNLYNTWRDLLIETMALLEAYIDFPDDDIPVEILQQVSDNITSLTKQIQTSISISKSNTNITQGIPIVLAGQPNAGKSTLLNLLAQQDVAIVSDIAGTTRDVIKVKLDIGGFLVLVADTAGINDNTKDTIELEGIKRSISEVGRAFVVIWLIDLSDDIIKQLDLLYATVIHSQNYLNISHHLASNRLLILLNKTDIKTQDQINQATEQVKTSLQQFIAKSTNQEMDNNQKSVCSEIIKILPFRSNEVSNLAVLLNSITEILTETHTSPLEPIITNARQLERLQDCLYFLQNFTLDKHLDMAAQDIRFAAESLSQLTGDIELDEILDKVFSSSCIGK